MYKATQLLTSWRDQISALPQKIIMKKYLGTASGKICSPFRVDNKPGCTFYYGNDNILYLKDWAINEQYHCISIMMRMEDITFAEALQQAKKEFGMSKPSIGMGRKKKSVLLQAVTDRWNDFARNYWKDYGIDMKTLRKFGVRNAKFIYRNKALVMKATRTNPVFVYTFYGTDKIKIYRPLARNSQYKWLGNISGDVWNGYHQLPKKGQLLLITSSLKDVMVLHKLGYNAIAPQSENSSFPKTLRDDLEKRFDHIVIFYDNDEPGLAAAHDLSSDTGYPFITIPSAENVKDVSDAVLRWGMRKTEKLVKRQLAKAFKLKDDELPF